MRSAGGILAILIAIIGICAGISRVSWDTEHRLIADSTADSALYYTFNRLSRTRWLSGVVDFSDPDLMPIPRAICPPIDAQRKSHFRDRSDRSIEAIADIRNNSGTKNQICTLQSLVAGAGFRTWVEPEHFRDDVPFPRWNGLFKIRVQAQYGSATAHRTCLIRAHIYPDDYVIFAGKAFSLFELNDSSVELPGPFFSNGICLIGDRVVAGTAQKTSRVVDVSIIDGQLIGNLMTSSLTSLRKTLDSGNSEQFGREAVCGNLSLERSFERVARFDIQDPFYPCDWLSVRNSVSSLDSFYFLPFCVCRNGQVRSISDVVDCSSRLDCEEGFNGLWVTHSTPAKNSLEAFAVSAEGSDGDSETGDMPQTLSRSTPDLFRIDFPELDFEALESIAAQSPEVGRRTNLGTVFASWDEFSDYINDPSNQFVSHHLGSQRLEIRVGRFTEDGHALDPLVFYIRKAEGDRDFPDRGCFRVDTPDSELILNGCLISETGIDLRDRGWENQAHPGRWREYSSGRDGRIVRFCGFPLKPATDPDACIGLPAYKWIDDGAWHVRILGYPGAPALAAAGDILIVDRHSRTIIEGPVMSQRGDILIWNAPVDDGAAVICHAPIIGANVQLAGSIRISFNDGLTKLDFLKNLGFYQFDIIEWNELAIAD